MSMVKPGPIPPKLRKATPEEKRLEKAAKMARQRLAAMDRRKVKQALRGAFKFQYLKRQSTAKSRPGRMSRAQEERMYSKRAAAMKERWRRRGWHCPVAQLVYGERLNIDDVHHKAGREGRLLLDESHWMPVSRCGHDWIRDHPNEARKQGWLYEVTASGEIKRR